VEGVIPTLAAIALSLPGIGAQPPVHAASVTKPRIVNSWIPFGPIRKRQMAAYSLRHYGKRSNLLTPRVLVEHWTQSNDYRSAYNLFAVDKPDAELGELPGTCAHFIVDRNGTIHQLVPLRYMCRHTVGLNDRAIGVENVGMSDAQIMGNHRQITATVKLARWLRCTYKIEIRDIIGHNENVRSRFHHERVRALRSQTHNDMRRSTMNRFRNIVARQSC
jgi:beta-N-acetylhexosaminidase